VLIVIHVYRIVSTPELVTGSKPFRLQIKRKICCNRQAETAVIDSKGAIRRRKGNTAKQTMKRVLLITAAAIMLGAMNLAQAQPPGGPHSGMHHNPLQELSSSLNLTDAENAKIQPIIDQAKPQLQAIHQDAMTKAKAVIDNAIAQIRPLLTPDQQTKLDAIVKAHQDMMNARKELHDAKTK
jgi:hypothetical protein